MLENGAFEALGGQVGQEHVIAAHLDGEGKVFSAPSEPKRGQKKTKFEDFVATFLDHIWSALSEAFKHEMGPRM